MTALDASRLQARQRIAEVLDRTKGQPPIDVLLALGKACSGDRAVWIEEIHRAMDGGR